MRKRSRYCPRDLMTMPPSWGISHEALVNLGLREAASLDALLNGKGTAKDYLTLEAACEAAIWSCDAAAAPEFSLDTDALSQLRARLLHCAKALLGIRDRAKTLGRYGCTGPQREDLKELCRLLHDMRSQIPRRAQLKGYDKALRSAGIPIPR